MGNEWLPTTAGENGDGKEKKDDKEKGVTGKRVPKVPLFAPKQEAESPEPPRRAQVFEAIFKGGELGPETLNKHPKDEEDDEDEDDNGSEDTDKNVERVETEERPGQDGLSAEAVFDDILQPGVSTETADDLTDEQDQGWPQDGEEHIAYDRSASEQEKEPETPPPTAISLPTFSAAGKSPAIVPPAPVMPGAAYNFAPSAPANNFMNKYAQSSNINYSTLVGHKQEVQDAERKSLRRGLVAGFIVGYVLKAYLANRKMERFEKATAKEFEQKDEQLTELQQSHNELSDKVAQASEQAKHQEKLHLEQIRAQTEAALKQAQPHVEVVYDQEGHQVHLRPGERLERRGWYSVVVDKHGREVKGAIDYGEAFKREQASEQVRHNPFAQDDNGPTGSGTIPVVPLVASGQVSLSHELSTGQPNAQHRLRASNNPARATLLNPWLWTAVAVLLAAYFIASLV